MKTMKQNRATILKQCIQLFQVGIYLAIIILTVPPIIDTNNNGESCIYVSNYDSVYQWFSPRLFRMGNAEYPAASIFSSACRTE